MFLLLILSSIACVSNSSHSVVDDHINFSDGPPIIDATSLITPSSSRQEVIKKLRKAAHDWGFFTIINHGISPLLIENLLNETQTFFNSGPSILNPIRRTITNSRGYTDQEYTKQKIDAKHIFDVGHKPYSNLSDSDPKNIVLDGYNQWPSSPEFIIFRNIVMEYYEECAKLSEILLEAIMESLATEEEANLQQYSIQSDFMEHTSFIRLNYYPFLNNTIAASHSVSSTTNSATATDSTISISIYGTIESSPSHSTSSSETQKHNISKIESTEILGVSRHTDAGALTVLLQDSVSALEVYTGSKQDFSDGTWVPVTPVSGGLTINVGDMLQVWSNDVFKAAEHRVKASTGNRTRLSVPFFYNPSYTALVTPKLSSRHLVARYRPILWGDFRRERFLGDFSNRGREVQIEDYRIV